MKVTGIVRRIDELGRIVIPKEIRKNLRIQDGESMEIVIVDDGNILLKRYMVMNKLEGLSQNFTDAIYGLVKKNVLITDIDKVIACSGKFKKEYLDKKISDELIEKIKRRECILENYFKELSIIQNNKLECSYAVNTITINGDAVGLIIIFSGDEKLDETDAKIIKIVCGFLERYLSE